MTNKYHASWTMFGRGYRTDLDETDPETQQLAQRIRREIALEFSRGELQQSFDNKGRSESDKEGGDKEDDVESEDNNDQLSKQINMTSTPAQQLMSNQFTSPAPRTNQMAITTVDERRSASPFVKAPANTAPTSAAFAAQTGDVTRPEAAQGAAQVYRAHNQENRQQRDQRNRAGFLGGMRDKATGLVDQLGGKSKHSKGKDEKL